MASELILLVDDEPSITQLARMYLERDGFRISEALDGESALEAAKQKPALIVLDVMFAQGGRLRCLPPVAFGGRSGPHHHADCAG